MMSTDLGLNLRLQNAIEGRLNTLTTQAQDLVQDTQLFQSEGMEESQMQNLVSVARETDSAEVVVNFILYQVGRDSSRKVRRDEERSWCYSDFGEELAKALRRLKGEAETIVTNVTQQEAQLEMVDEVWIHLIRHYVGQLRRYFHYRKNFEGGEL
jgi:hypothetical protein